MDKGSAFFSLPPIASGAGTQHIEAWMGTGSNFVSSLYGGEGQCSAENQYFRAVAWGVPFVTVPPASIFAGIQTGRGL